MHEQTIDTAAREYANRPPDERYPSLPALIEHCLKVKNSSAERTYNLHDLQIIPAVRASDTGAVLYGGGKDADTLRLQSPRGQAKFTPWSFSQLCRTVGAPAGYVRDLPPGLAADCLNFGLHDQAAGTSANLLVQANGEPEPTIRACTSDSYGRLWDSDLYGSVARMITDRDPSWGLPPTWSGEPAGAYDSDRDSFLIVTNGGSIVNDPSLRSSQSAPDGSDPGAMYRGLLIRNSEVGASSVTIETILYRYICGNHMLWGAMVDRSFRRRHFGSHVLRDTVREIARIAYEWGHASPARDQAIIRALIDHEVASTKEAVIDELRALGASKEQAEQAYDVCEQTEGASPRSFWGLAQGLTRTSQSSGYQDARYELDRIAASLLLKGRKLIAA